MSKEYARQAYEPTEYADPFGNEEGHQVGSRIYRSMQMHEADIMTDPV
jgi:hypothetical protein